MSTSLVCQRCQKEVNPVTEEITASNGVFHTKATCPRCGQFIRFIGHGKPAVLYFGKYRGRLMADVAKEDPDYLHWLYSQDIKANLKRQIDEALSAL